MDKRLIRFFILAGFIALIISACTTTNDYEIGVLSKEEKTDIQKLREEEKLARDIYIKAYNTYEYFAFVNLYKGEQIHMDNLLNLEMQYMVEDIILPDTGKYVDESIQNFYNNHLSQITTSATDAFKVGMTTEEMIIYDIQNFENNTEEADILKVYSKIKCWSRNHLRLNYNFLNGDTLYQPQYITIEEYNAIINSDYENCE